MEALTEQLTDFIEEQPIFFVATAAARGRVNVSPKGMDTLRVVAPDRVVWLSLTGSGNETAAHTLADDRITLMFCSFTEMPLILRLYGTARVVHPRDPDWDELIELFPELGGSRQIFDVHIDEVATSCGTGVPVMDLRQIRADEELEPFYAAMTADELQDYWARKNTTSIDGFPTAILGERSRPIGRIDVAALDCPDARALGAFYQSMLGGEMPDHPDGDWVELHTAHGNLAFQQINDHVPPTWPGGAVPQQAHIDIDVDALDDAEQAVLELGAVKADTQPSPDNFRVFLDPAGHPFCLVQA